MNGFVTEKLSAWDPVVFMASLMANLLSLALPLAILQLYDRVIPNQSYDSLIVLGLIVLFALSVDAILRLSRARLLAFFAAQFEQRAYSHAYASLLKADPSQRRGADVGTMVGRFGAIERLRAQHANGAVASMMDLPFALLFLAFIAVLSPMIACAVAVTLALTVGALSFYRKAIDRARLARQRVDARRYSFLNEVLAGLKSVRAMQISDLMERRQERLLAQSARETKEVTRNVHAAQGLTTAVGSLVPLVTAATAGYLVISGDASIGVLAAVVVLSGRIVQPVLRLEGYLSSVENTKQSEADLDALTNIPQRPQGSIELRRVQRLAMRNVETEEDPETGLSLQGVSVDLKKGECLLIESDDPRRLALAERLFLGELPLLRGAYMLNEHPFDHHLLDDRQDLIRVMPEKAELLDGSVFDNICSLRPQTYRSRALDLAQKLGLHQMMQQSQAGLMTSIRSDHPNLPQSAHRIAANICALVTQPDVLIFHMANSGLDHGNDRRLLDWLKNNSQDHILILLTNRPSYKALATHELHLAAGRAPNLRVV